MRTASWGRAVFAVTMIALGILGLIKGTFTSTWTGVPNGLPLREALAYLSAVVSLAAGIGLFVRRAAVVTSRILLVYLVVWLLLFRVSHFFFAPAAVDTWWGCADTAVMIAAAWVLYASLAVDRTGKRLSFATGANGLRIARAFYGVGLIPFGLAHFTNLKDTAPLVPGWLPWHVFWAYFTGSAFIAAGLAVLLGVYARLAATLSTLEIGLFTVLVWVPIVTTGASPSQWTEFVTSWVLTAAGWVVADSYRGTPWLAVGARLAPVRTPASEPSAAGS